MSSCAFRRKQSYVNLQFNV